MFELLLYTTLSCSQADAVMFRITTNKHLEDELKLELIETVKESAPECDYYWDANDWRNGKKRILQKQRRLIFTQLQE